MASFAKFILLDSGRPIHLNPLFIEQVREGAEPGTTAVYFAGRSGPIALQEKVETVMRQLFGAPAPRLVSSTPAVKVKPEVAKPEVAKLVAMAPKAKRGAR
jgi:uncharacterized protein YlzI (FlbEa/FlbD family)